jgi:hypothetical protein
MPPSNKPPGAEGTELYRAKQREVIHSNASLVEIDLLRSSGHVAAVTRERLQPYQPYDYLAVVCRATSKQRREAYPIRLRTRLPRISIPLCAPDADVEVDLQSLVEHAYEGGAYWKRINYGNPPAVALADEDTAWARGLQ